MELREYVTLKTAHVSENKNKLFKSKRVHFSEFVPEHACARKKIIMVSSYILFHFNNYR